MSKALARSKIAAYDGLFRRNPFRAAIFYDSDSSQYDEECSNDSLSNEIWKALQSLDFIDINKNYYKLQETYNEVKRATCTYIVMDETIPKKESRKYVT